MVEGAAYKAFTEVSNFAWAKPRHQRPGGRYFTYFFVHNSNSSIIELDNFAKQIININ